MIDYEFYDELDDDEEVFWTRRQIIITIIALIMVITLLAAMASPLLRTVFGISRSSQPPPTRGPLEQVFYDYDHPLDDLLVTFSDDHTVSLG